MSSYPNIKEYRLIGNGIDLTNVEFISNKKYTFYEPNWLYSNHVLKILEQQHPNFDVETMMLCAPLCDIVSGAVQDLSYWEDRRYIKYVDDVQKGFLPVLLDENSLSLSNIKISENSFVAPKFIPIFFIVNNIKGKNSVTWTLYDDTDPNNRVKLIRVKGVSYFVFRFPEEGIFSLDVEVKDLNGGVHVGESTNIIKIVNREEYINVVETLLDSRKVKIQNK